MAEYKGKISAAGKRIGIVASKFNDFITSRLVDGVLDAVEQFGGDLDLVDIYWVPGAFEIPLVLKKLAESGKYDGLVALSAVIRGETPHFDYVAAEVTKGIARVMLDAGLPVAYGVITADTFEQAEDRAGGKMGNKGRDAILSLLETLSVIENI